MSNTRSRNKSVRNPTNGSVSDISEAFKRQMATGGSEKVKGKNLKNSSKTPKEKADNANNNAKVNKINEQEQKGNEENLQSPINDNHDNLDKEKNNESEQEEALTNVVMSEDECHGSNAFDNSHENENNVTLNKQSSDKRGGEGEGDKRNDEEKESALNAPEEQNCDDKDEQPVLEATNAEILESLQEVCALVKKLDNDIHHPKFGIGAKLVQLTLRMDNLYTDIHGAVEGLIPRVNQVEESAQTTSNSIDNFQENQKKIIALINDMKKLTHDVNLMKNMFQKHSQKIQVLERNVMDLTRRGMEQNLVFHGIMEFEAENAGDKEDCKQVIIDFAQEKLGVTIQPRDVWKAHRSGQRKMSRARVIVTKLAYEAKEAIMGNVSKLKSMTNAHNQKVFVNEQVPEGITESRKQVSDRLKTLKAENEAKPVEERKTIQVMNDKIVINGEVEEPEIKTPEPEDLFMDSSELRIVRALGSKMKETKVFNLKNSSFIGLALKVHTAQEVNRAYKAVSLRFPSVDHVMMAYAFKEAEKVKIGNCDDGEYGGSNIIKQALKANKVKDTAVFVVRKYGGIHLGFDRFSIIESVTKEALKLLKGG